MNKFTVVSLGGVLYFLSGCASLPPLTSDPAALAAWDKANDARYEAELVKSLREAPRSGPFSVYAQNAHVEAAKKLGEMHVYSAIPDLTQALKDPNPSVRANAAYSLSLMADHTSPAQVVALTETLNDVYTGVKYYSAFALYKMNAKGVDLIPALKGLCATTGLDLLNAVRAADLAITITSAPKDYIPALMKGMADPEMSERVVSVISKETQYREYLPILIAGTTSDRASVRSTSVGLLGTSTYASPEVTAIVRRMATSDENEDVRISATHSLVSREPGRFGGNPLGAAEGTGDETIALLVTLLQGHDAGVRKMAADALGDARVNTPKVIGLLIDRLQDPDNDVRSSAANALGQIGKPASAAKPALLAIWHHYIDVLKPSGKASSQDQDLARAVFEALAEMGEEMQGSW